MTEQEDIVEILDAWIEQQGGIEALICVLAAAADEIRGLREEIKQLRRDMDDSDL